MRHVESLPNRFNIPIKPDKDGYLGRECPIKVCKGYFKITPGTGLKGRVPCHCPYCGHSAKMSDFTTQAQIEYAKSVVIRQGRRRCAPVRRREGALRAVLRQAQD
jgi:hypothetical protein